MVRSEAWSQFAGGGYTRGGNVAEGGFRAGVGKKVTGAHPQCVCACQDLQSMPGQNLGVWEFGGEERIVQMGLCVGFSVLHCRTQAAGLELLAGVLALVG